VVLDPAAIRELAVATANSAHRLADVGDGLVRRADEATWQGTAADQFRTAMGERRTRCLTDASTLHDLSVELHNAANRYEQELDALTGLERRIRDWFAAHPDASASLPGCPVTPDSLPPPGSPLWRETASTLAQYGVRI